jgi:hypothetical protein
MISLPFVFGYNINWQTGPATTKLKKWTESGGMSEDQQILENIAKSKTMHGIPEKPVTASDVERMINQQQQPKV